MSWLDYAAQRVRGAIEQQGLPEGWQAIVAQMPDWMLLAIGPGMMLIAAIIAWSLIQRVNPFELTIFLLFMLVRVAFFLLALGILLPYLVLVLLFDAGVIALAVCLDLVLLPAYFVCVALGGGFPQADETPLPGATGIALSWVGQQLCRFAEPGWLKSLLEWLLWGQIPERSNYSRDPKFERYMVGQDY